MPRLLCECKAILGEPVVPLPFLLPGTLFPGPLPGWVLPVRFQLGSFIVSEAVSVHPV